MKSYLIGFAGAVVGGSLLLLALHLWQDHQVHHEMLKVLQNAAQQQLAKPAVP